MWCGLWLQATRRSGTVALAAIPSPAGDSLRAVKGTMPESDLALANQAFLLNYLVLAVGRERDRTAFSRLFNHFAPRLKAYLMRLGADSAGAEELVQEVMLLVWRRADTFDPAQANASTWIFTIARNKRIDILRRERRPEIDAEDPALVPATPEPADTTVEAYQEAVRLKAAIRALPEEQADLLRRAYYEDKAHSTISNECGLPLGTVKSRLRLALDRLRKALREDR